MHFELDYATSLVITQAIKHFEQFFLTSCLNVLFYIDHAFVRSCITRLILVPPSYFPQMNVELLTLLLKLAIRHKCDFLCFCVV